MASPCARSRPSLQPETNVCAEHFVQARNRAWLLELHGYRVRIGSRGMIVLFSEMSDDSDATQNGSRNTRRHDRRSESGPL